MTGLPATSCKCDADSKRLTVIEVEDRWCQIRYNCAECIEFILDSWSIKIIPGHKIPNIRSYPVRRERKREVLVCQ